MLVGAMAVTMVMESHPDALPWRELGIDVVIDCTGRLTNRDKAAAHLHAGARRVIISAPAKGVDGTFVVGVNEDTFDPERDFVVSNASCTTNCLAVLAKVLDDAFGVEEGFMTTVHAYTDDQHLVDALHKDPLSGAWRRHQHHPDDDWRRPGHRTGASRRRRPARRAVASSAGARRFGH